MGACEKVFPTGEIRTQASGWTKSQHRESQESIKNGMSEISGLLKCDWSKKYNRVGQEDGESDEARKVGWDQFWGDYKCHVKLFTLNFLFDSWGGRIVIRKHPTFKKFSISSG